VKPSISWSWRYELNLPEPIDDLESLEVKAGKLLSMCKVAETKGYPGLEELGQSNFFITRFENEYGWATESVGRKMMVLCHSAGHIVRSYGIEPSETVPGPWKGHFVAFRKDHPEVFGKTRSQIAGSGCEASLDSTSLVVQCVGCFWGMLVC
jgi:hypothetical protein